MRCKLINCIKKPLFFEGKDIQIILKKVKKIHTHLPLFILKNVETEETYFFYACSVK